MKEVIYNVKALRQVGKYRIAYVSICKTDDYKVAKSVYNQLVSNGEEACITPIEQ